MTELEKIGLIPRSIVRMLDRFYYQLYLGTAEPLVKQFRFSKYLLLTSVKSLLLVLFIPFFINIFTKIYVFRPLVEFFWDRKQTEIFLNYELQEKAFSDIKNFEEKIYFDYLIKIDNHYYQEQNVRLEQDLVLKDKDSNLLLFQKAESNFSVVKMPASFLLTQEVSLLLSKNLINVWFWEKNFYATQSLSAINTIQLNNALLPEFDRPTDYSLIEYYNKNICPDINFVSFDTSLGGIYFLDNSQRQNVVQLSSNESTELILKQKIRELAEHYNHESIEAITNLFSDFMGLIILLFLLINMKMSLMNTTAFLSESFFSLKDSKKAFLMLLFTDLLVGFHSPRGWEVIFHFLFEHFGLPENENIIFLLVGTFPVLLDALFKYWIFRHLNRHSPATVATFQAMVE
uniref:Potassium/proton antiporter CemA n=1 Tax=Aphanochaete confervicola TaxID=764104 RepID=A0A6H1XE34_9CHLO|nr:chloroplast envelope membrane protein [Aphanochaete confervicola]QJA13869.1 chloroplast envelope membrane protein [Aphanochaete confervicola]